MHDVLIRDNNKRSRYLIRKEKNIISRYVFLDFLITIEILETHHQLAQYSQTIYSYSSKNRVT